jgi:hypothetical protein
MNNMLVKRNFLNFVKKNNKLRKFLINELNDYVIIIYEKELFLRERILL